MHTLATSGRTRVALIALLVTDHVSGAVLAPRVFVLLSLTFALVASQVPLSVLRAAKGSPVLVELESGETYNGQFVSTDAYMNCTVSQVICAAASGDRF